jgi:hypothetical protein
MPNTTRRSRRRIGLAVLIVGYPAHFAASLWLPHLEFVSITCWLAALGGGALYCAETLARLRRPT